MNTKILPIFVLTLLAPPLLASAQTVQTSCPSLSHNLSIGLSGSDVVALQDFLIVQNLLPQGDNTGYFGRLTKAAAIQFQTQQSLPMTGLVGPLTRAAIAKVCGGSQATTATTSQQQSIGASQGIPSALANTPPPSGSPTTLSYISDGEATPRAGDAIQLWGNLPVAQGDAVDYVDVYFGTTLATKSAAVYSANGCPTTSTCFRFANATIPQIAPGTYPVTFVGADGTSNSLNFTVYAGQTPQCPASSYAPVHCLSGYHGQSDTNGCFIGCVAN
jgi:peptidoglycan hydrolase-like protein with peptidoglycan-binding domain